MQTDTELITAVITWQSVKLANGAYRVQNIRRIDRLPDLHGFKNCTECGVFVDQLECVRASFNLQDQSLWLEMMYRTADNDCASVTALLWGI